MLGSYMEDIGMTPEQFENACSKNITGGVHIRFHQVGALVALFLSPSGSSLNVLIFKELCFVTFLS
jgi:hypothetical protein